MNFCNFTLAEWLSFLENRHQQEIQLGLQRITAVAKRLNLLQPQARVITVAGTNGKGSTVAALEAIYHAAGYQVASYTSPHLISFNERIRVNQQAISDANLCAAFLAIEEGRAEIDLTYFEMATLAALWYFKSFKLDIIILEVGLGGRQDATNIIDADLAIISTVDLDHQDYLGDTTEAIGYEKAGILRANKPFIYADSQPPASVIACAKALNAKIHCLDLDYSYKTTANSLQVLCGDTIKLPLPKINPKAASAAILASQCLQPILPVTVAEQAEAMRAVSILGRQQVICGIITTVLDVAHNPQAVSLLADFIGRLQPKARVHAVFSGLKDKDLCGLIKPMRSCVDEWYPAVLSGKRAASESLLLDAFSAANLAIPSCFKHPVDAYQAAVKRSKPGDLIVVYGSFLIVGAIMAVQCAHIEQEEVQ